MIKIAFIGIPGVGKTAYAGALKYDLLKQNKDLNIELILTSLKEKQLLTMDLTNKDNLLIAAKQQYFVEDQYESKYTHQTDYLITDNACFMYYLYANFLGLFNNLNNENDLEKFHIELINIMRLSNYNIIVFLQPSLQQKENIIIEKFNIIDLNEYMDNIIPKIVESINSQNKKLIFIKNTYQNINFITETVLNFNIKEMINESLMLH